MPAHYVAPYVKRNKNDANDAEGVCEAVTRPSMRFVEIKDEETQGVMVQHRARQIIMRQKTQAGNAIRSLMAEYGIVARVGRLGLEEVCDIVRDRRDKRLPHTARQALKLLVKTLEALKQQLLAFDQLVHASAKDNELSRRLMRVPGVGPILASAITASVPDPDQFKSGRDLAAWVGLVPRQNSSGNSVRIGGISKAGNPYLRLLLVQGAMAVMKQLTRSSKSHSWLRGIADRKPYRVAATAYANKVARIIWAMMKSGEEYRLPAPAMAA